MPWSLPRGSDRSPQSRGRPAGWDESDAVCALVELSRALAVATAELGRHDEDRKEVDTADAFLSASSSQQSRGARESKEHRRSKISGVAAPDEGLEFSMRVLLEEEHADDDD